MGSGRDSTARPSGVYIRVPPRSIAFGGVLRDDRADLDRVCLRGAVRLPALPSGEILVVQRRARAVGGDVGPRGRRAPADQYIEFADKK